MKEEFVLKSIRQLTENKNGIALDIGANHGKYTTLLARKFKKVYAFEPAPFNVVFLKRSLNGRPNVEVVQQALSNEIGTTKFYINHFNPGAHTIVPAIAGTGIWGHDLETFIEIPTITLDKFLEKEDSPVVAIKCDVEGAEDFLFDGAVETLKNNKIDIILEIHLKVRLERLYDFFMNLGFRFIDEDEQVTDYFRHDVHYLLSNWR